MLIVKCENCILYIFIAIGQFVEAQRVFKHSKELEIAGILLRKGLFADLAICRFPSSILKRPTVPRFRKINQIRRKRYQKKRKDESYKLL